MSVDLKYEWLKTMAMYGVSHREHIY